MIAELRKRPLIERPFLFYEYFANAVYRNLMDKLKHWNKKATWLSTAEALCQGEKILAQLPTQIDFRLRRTAIKQLAYTVCSLAYNNESLNFSAIEKGIVASQTVSVNGGDADGFSRAVGYLLSEYYRVSGAVLPSVITEKKKQIVLDAATVCVAETTEAGIAILSNTLDLKNFAYYAASIGFDCKIGLITRMVDEDNLMPQMEELRYLVRSGQKCLVQNKSGILLIGAAEDLSKGILLELPIGDYHFQFHHLVRGHSSRVLCVGSSASAPLASTNVWAEIGL